MIDGRIDLFMIKTAFITETMQQEILGVWAAKKNLMATYSNLEDNPIVKKALTIFISSIASSGYSIDYSIKLDIKESIDELNTYFEKNNLGKLYYNLEKNIYPSDNDINKIIEKIGMSENRKIILAKASNLKNLLKINNRITDTIKQFFDTIDLESMIELALKDMYLIGSSFWLINTKDGFSLEYIPFESIIPRFKSKGKLFVFDGWNIVDNGEVLQKLKSTDVLVFNVYTPIEYPGKGVVESIYSFIDTLDADIADLRTQRATRSGIKLLHYPDLQSIGRKAPLTEDEMKEYIKINKLTTNSVKTDYYSNGLWKIDVLKADDTIDNVQDIQMIKEIAETGLLVPHGLIESGQNVNRSTLDVQIAYYITIAYTIANDLSNKLTYLVKNYISDGTIKRNNVKITWKYTEPQSLLDKAKMMAYLKNQFIQMPMYKLVTDIMRWDWDSFLAAVKKDEEYISIIQSMPDQSKQIQAPSSQVDPDNSHNNLKKK